MYKLYPEKFAFLILGILLLFMRKVCKFIKRDKKLNTYKQLNSSQNSTDP